MSTDPADSDYEFDELAYIASLPPGPYTDPDDYHDEL